MIVTQPLFIIGTSFVWPARLNLIPILYSPYLETRRIVGRGFIRNNRIFVSNSEGWLTKYDKRGDIATLLSPAPLLLRAPIGADFFWRQTPP